MATPASLRNALMLRSDPLGFFSRLAAFGERISAIDLPAGRVYLVNEPDLVAQLLLERTGKVQKFLFPGICEAFGSGILNSAGAIHSAVRHAAQPSFHRPQIEEWNASVRSTIDESLSHLVPEQETDIKAFFERVTLVIVGHLLFALDLRKIAGKFFHYVEQMQQCFQQIEASPAAADRFHDASRGLDRILEETLREQPSTRNEGVLLRSFSATGQVNERQMLHEVRGFLMACMPASMLLGAACWLLAGHPEEQIRGEANEKETVSQENVINETLRLYPPAWLMGRETVEPFQLDGISFPPGTVFLVCLWTLHRSPRSFSDPDCFLPGRWNGKPDLPRGAYIPFSLGARNCLGERLSRMIAEHGLTGLLQRFRLAKSDQHNEIQWLPRITLSPATGIWVKLHRLSTI